MPRSEAVKASVIEENVFNLEKYKHLKYTFQLPDTAPIRSSKKKSTKSNDTKLLTDRQRVAKVQKSKNNYRDAKPTK